MYLSEVFEQLFYGELSQTNIGPTASKTAIAIADYPRLINYINLGVLALYKRFLLLETTHIIQLYDHITDYYLKWIYAYSNDDSTETYKYIIDSATNPFNTYRPIKILDVFNELGQPYELNPDYVDFTLEAVESAYTPSPLHLQVPYPDSDNAISVTCQSAPQNIATSNTAPTTTEVEIPDILLEPLLLFIAERYFTGMTSSKDEARVYPNKFKKACDDIERQNLLNKDAMTGANRFWRNGWV